MGMSICKVSTLLLLVAAAIAPSKAYAWGYEGHEIVALIAAQSLTPAARAHVTDLLGGPDATTAMKRYSTWADKIRRSRPNTSPWHYVDIEIDGSGYSRSHDCPNEDCVVGQIERDIRVLRDTALAKLIRADALRFLIHFVGDESQPLHCSDEHDRGGNEVQVVLRRRRTNLHRIWDTSVVTPLGRNSNDVAAILSAQITPSEKSAWSKGTPAGWAEECWGVAKRKIYANLKNRGGGEPIILSPDYTESASSIAAQQLKRAGIRLATILNTIFR
jgi:hypothetical protein